MFVETGNQTLCWRPTVGRPVNKSTWTVLYLCIIGTGLRIEMYLAITIKKVLIKRAARI